MDKDTKKELHIFTTDLMNRLDVLKVQGFDEEVLSLLERTNNIGSIAILYCDSIPMEELKTVVGALQVADEIASRKIEDDTEVSITGLLETVSNLENAFRDKRLLLDDFGEKTIA